MDPITIIGLVVVAVMFCSGVALVWIGLRHRPDRLPVGAEDILAAVAEGRLSSDGDQVIDLVHPPQAPPRAAQPTPAVRLVSRDAHDAGSASSASVTSEPAATGASTIEARTPRTAIEAAAVALRDADLSAKAPVASNETTRDFDQALFGELDDPSARAGEQAFFAKTPELQRF